MAHIMRGVGEGSHRGQRRSPPFVPMDTYTNKTHREMQLPTSLYVYMYIYIHICIYIYIHTHLFLYIDSIHAYA